MYMMYIVMYDVYGVLCGAWVAMMYSYFPQESVN